MGFAYVRAGTRVPSTRPNISESHSEISTRVPFCIAKPGTRPNISESHSEISTHVYTLSLASTMLALSRRPFRRRRQRLYLARRQPYEGHQRHLPVQPPRPPRRVGPSALPPRACVRHPFLLVPVAPPLLLVPLAPPFPPRACLSDLWRCPGCGLSLKRGHDHGLNTTLLSADPGTPCILRVRCRVCSVSGVAVQRLASCLRLLCWHRSGRKTRAKNRNEGKTATNTHSSCLCSCFVFCVYERLCVCLWKNLRSGSRATRASKGYSSTYLAMGFANVRAGTRYPPEH